MTKVISRLRKRRQNKPVNNDTRLTDDLEREMLKALAHFNMR